WVIISVFIIAACSTENLDDLETDVQLNRETRELSENVDLKQGHAAQNRLLAQVRRATAKYQRVDVAMADGYAQASPCVYNDELGAGMGFHFVNEDLVGPFFDPLKPQALLYEQDEYGEFNLVGVEYIVIDIGQDHPHFGNHPFDVGGTPVPVDHYSLHVWVWKHNPLGMYFPFNPNVSCYYDDMD
ncbi:MAG: hypothetical protein K0B37_16795, partial [Bacteroidales bacterium]|nr:hypothetical protein [Bacteroidales bacterium]